MQTILCIESGTDVCSVALSKDGKLISLRESTQGRQHASNLALYVDEILESNNIKAEDLDAVALSEGPGSYTGLRIGTSLAKGLCFATDKNLVAVGSLLSMAAVAMEDFEAGLLGDVDPSEYLLCPMIDARRMEVYTQLFDSQMNPLTEVEAIVVDENLFSDIREKTGKKLLIFGDGAQKCEEVIPSDIFTRIEVIPSARGLISAASKAIENSDFKDVAYFEPFYLKDFIIKKSNKKIF
ncbi:MAG: tRNA (adenosine(37)-N6)-threonylcarbamoyltransferase complex dimerization subunit type 1 TsaB [Rikenellaceae bacterium]